MGPIVASGCLGQIGIVGVILIRDMYIFRRGRLYEMGCEMFSWWIVAIFLMLCAMDC